MKEKRLEQFLLFMSLVAIIVIMYNIFNIFNSEYKKVDIDEYLDNELFCVFC
jgi:hypothetical protein